MSEKIVGIFGRVPPLANGADPEVIDTLRKTLDEAERGEIICVAIVSVRRNLVIGTRCSNQRGHRHLLVAGCEYLKNDIVNADDGET